MSVATVVALIQCALIAVMMGLLWGVASTWSILPIPIGFAVGAWFVFMRVSVDNLHRAFVRFVAVRVGGLCAMIGAGLYWSMYLKWPQSFDLTVGEAAFIGAAVGCGIGFVSLCCTLMAGDTAATMRSKSL